MSWQANVFTLFPDAFPGNLGVSIIGKALAQQKWQLNIIDLKKFPVSSDRVDSKPQGGGAGMILSPLVFEKAFETLSEKFKESRNIYFSPRGRQFKQKDLQQISESEGINILCGRYEGVDQRILEYYDMEEISVGDFVLAGGEVAAMALIEGCVRLLPEVLGNHESIVEESFSNHLLEYHQYTKPQSFRELEAPKILSSGNHENVKKFRLEQSKKLTRQRRPDLWAEYVESELLK